MAQRYCSSSTSSKQVAQQLDTDNMSSTVSSSLGDVPRVVELTQSAMRKINSQHALSSSQSSENFSGGEEADLFDFNAPKSTYGSLSAEPRRHVRRLFPSSSSLTSSHSTLTTNQLRYGEGDYCSKFTIYLCVLVSDMCRGIMFPTLWLLVRSLGGSKSTQGLVVASFSAGRIVSSPFVGHLSEVFGYRNVLVACNAVIVLGAFVYVVANSVVLVLLAQFIIGLGAGR
jgi:hypothetical protein